MHLFKRKGLGLYPGGVHVKIQMGMLGKFFRSEIWADPVFLGGIGSKIGLLGKIDVLKGLLGRKGAFGSKMELLGKTDFLEGLFV